VLLLFALVPTGNDEHDDTVRSSDEDGTGNDTGGGSLLRSVTAVLGVVERIAVARSTVAVAVAIVTIAVAKSIRELTQLKGNCRVNLRRQVEDENILALVQSRVGQLDIDLELVKHAGRVGHMGACSDIAQRGHCVQRHEPPDDNLANIKSATSTLSQSLRQKLEDLSGSLVVGDHEIVVVSLTETNLDQGGIYRCWLVSGIRCDCPGEAAWNATCRGWHQTGFRSG